MANINSLLRWMSYDDTKRQRLEREERQASKDALTMFNQLASRNITSAVGLEDLANRETDPGRLELIAQEADTLLTGVEDVDNIIGVKRDSIELRKRAVDTRDAIDEELNALVASMDSEPSEGAAAILSSLRKQYTSQADNMTAAVKSDLDKRLKTAYKQNEFNTLRRQFDTDLIKPGIQYPETFTEAQKDYYEDAVDPLVRVADDTRTEESYTEAISRMREAFPQMRQERMTAGTAGRAATNAAIKDIEEQINLKRETVMNRVQGGIINFKSGLTHLAERPKDDEQRKIYDALVQAQEFTSSKSGDRQSAFDYQGALVNIERAIIKASRNDKHNLKRDSDELANKTMTKEHVQHMEDLIEENTYVRSDETESYLLDYDLQGSASGMFELIEAWRTLRKAVDSKLTGTSAGMSGTEDFFLDFELPDKEDEPDTSSVSASMKTKY